MTDPHIIPLANHMLTSIQKDLRILKDHQVLDDNTLQNILALLPTQVTAAPTPAPRNHLSQPTLTTSSTTSTPSSNNIRPPLPTRKSTASSHSPSLAPIPAPRTPSFPKLPARRTPDWQQPDILNTRDSTPQPPPSYNATVKNKQMVEAIYDYTGEDPTTDLSFRKGDMIEVTEHVNDDWWRGSLHGKTGIFPQNHVQPLPAQKQSSPATSIAKTTPQVYSSPQVNNHNNYQQQPYSYPPPPTMVYHTPPYQVSGGSSTYATPPPQVVTAGGSNVTEDKGNGEGNGKVQNMAKKFGSKVGEAAVFGFGATLGSEAAHAIF
ncbi:SH3 domain-containing protein [Halteromyces radiatus]|uniref:SH3 domain-containing protein n=1 Tax=Halteromyces radiatus TaxID=101107 RepID=UPI00221F6D88|nr:SH3 domain-containing protein [Halteromyces radiatus]KAI8088824.1 SH3 domain-containing protein [Halteromyces radiatus]